MKEFDYLIIGGGCAGLSLAYELEINGELKNKTLAIIEPREEYKRDKTWSFWKVFDHNFEDCVIKSWNNFTVNSHESSQELTNKNFPYQSIDSGKCYEKINSKISSKSWLIKITAFSLWDRFNNFCLIDVAAPISTPQVG